MELIPNEMAEMVPLKKYNTVKANKAPKRDGIKIRMGVEMFL
jgi:hypothetical protein